MASYLFTIQAPTPLINRDVIRIKFPANFNIPLVNTLKSCVGVNGLTAALTCNT